MTSKILLLSTLSLLYAFDAHSQSDSSRVSSIVNPTANEKIIIDALDHFREERTGGKILQALGVAALSVLSVEKYEGRNVSKSLFYVAGGLTVAGISIDIHAGRYLKKKKR